MVLQHTFEKTSVATGKLLEVNHLSVDYLAGSGAVHAVNDVSFTLERGQILGLAGESGCGKSTLAYAITRLLRPPAFVAGGELLYYPRPRENEQEIRTDSSTRGKNSPVAQGEAVDILKMTPKQLRTFRWSELSMVFQSAMNALNPVLTVGKQITDVIHAHRPRMSTQARKERALELLKVVGIASDRINSYPHQLSGGMRQRAMIAIALALSPELIIMDEPTTALDVVMQREILTEIIRLREQFGFSVIFITHDLSLLLELTDRVAIMYAGRMIELASRHDLYLHPRHPYSYGLLNSFPTLHGPRRESGGIPGSPPDLRAVPQGCAFHPRCPLAFEPCNQVVPGLIPSTLETQEQLVACHLYDSRFSAEGPPDAATFAEQYRLKRERSRVR